MLISLTSINLEISSDGDFLEGLLTVLQSSVICCFHGL